MAARIPNPGNPSSERLSRVVDTSFPTGDVTVVYQIKFVTDRTNAFQTYFAIGPDVFDGANNYYVTFDGDGVVSNNFAIGSEGVDAYATVSPTLPSLNIWFQQGFKRSGNNLSFFHDLSGTGLSAVITQTASGAPTWATGHQLQFGSNNWSNNAEPADCWMRYIKVWSKALTDTDLQSEATSGAIVTSAGGTNIWGQWPLNLDALDISGNARHLTASSGVTFVADALLDRSLFNTQRFQPRTPGVPVWMLMHKLPNPAGPLSDFRPNPIQYINKFPGQRPGLLIWMLMHGLAQQTPPAFSFDPNPEQFVQRFTGRYPGKMIWSLMHGIQQQTPAGPPPPTTIAFRKTLSMIGTGTGKRQLHNTN